MKEIRLEDALEMVFALGLHVMMLKSESNGRPWYSVTIQTHDGEKEIHAGSYQSLVDAIFDGLNRWVPPVHALRGESKRINEELAAWERIQGCIEARKEPAT